MCQPGSRVTLPQARHSSGPWNLQVELSQGQWRWRPGARAAEAQNTCPFGMSGRTLCLRGAGGDFLQTAHPGRQESWGPGTRDLFPVVSTAEQSVLPRVPAPKWEGRAVQGIHPRRGPKPPPAAGWTPDNLVQEQKHYFHITFFFPDSRSVTNLERHKKKMEKKKSAP